MYALSSIRSLRDDNVITSKHTWKLKHTNSILESVEYSCQMSSKWIFIISNYTVSKSVGFWDTVYLITSLFSMLPRSAMKKIIINDVGDVKLIRYLRSRGSRWRRWPFHRRWTWWVPGQWPAEEPSRCPRAVRRSARIRGICGPRVRLRTAPILPAAQHIIHNHSV